MICQYPPRFSHDTNFGSLENSEEVVYEVYTKSVCLVVKYPSSSFFLWYIFLRITLSNKSY